MWPTTQPSARARASHVAGLAFRCPTSSSPMKGNEIPLASESCLSVQPRRRRADVSADRGGWARGGRAHRYFTSSVSIVSTTSAR